MAGSAAFESARRGSNDVTVALQANEPSASTPSSRAVPAGGLLRPSQIPVPGAAAALTASFLAGGGNSLVRGGHPNAAAFAMQRSIANAAVFWMPDSALHRHGTGRGHQQAAPAPVQRSAVHDVLSGPGQPLAAPVMQEMEARLGADFSDVRVHTDAAARASAAEVGARAYTSGSHVVIGDGADKQTLAHELTHVIQQRTGPVAGTDHGNGLRLSDPSDSFEHAAESNAARVMSGSAQRPQAGPLIYRQASHPRLVEATPLALQPSARNPAAARFLTRTRPRTCKPDGVIVQRQPYGRIGGSYIRDPLYNANAAWAPGDNTEFVSVNTENERYANRAEAFAKATKTFGGAADVKRTYHVFDAFEPPIYYSLGQTFVMYGPTLRNGWGRYYDYGSGRIVAEHTDDPQATYHNLNAAGVRTNAITPAPHFHTATYPTLPRPEYHTGAAVRNRRGEWTVNEQPRVYNQIGPNHHVYY